MLEESTADSADFGAESYLAAHRDHDANREILESGDYFQSAEVIIVLIRGSLPVYTMLLNYTLKKNFGLV